MRILVGFSAVIALQTMLLLAKAFQMPVQRIRTLRIKPLSLQKSPLSTDSLLSEAESFLDQTTTTPSVIPKLEDSTTTASRRIFFASTLMAVGAAISAKPASAAVSVGRQQVGQLQWQQSPVNKRSGVTVFDAERAGYNVRFVTYLSRFLLCFDQDCQKWWFSRAADIPRTATKEEIDKIRMRQFGAFSASVEVGLQEYRGPDGPRQLMASLLKRYSPDSERLAKMVEGLNESAEGKLRREVNEAKRQIALLFGLMETSQPVEEITKLLAAIDNGRIEKVEIVDGGSGYAPGYGPPLVTFPQPISGNDFVTAKGRATLEPNGKILRIDLVNRGNGYTKPPTVTIAPPLAASKGDTTAVGATAKALPFRSGINKGRIERIQLIDAGSGYTKDEVIKVKISPPDVSPADGGVTATATAVLEYQVSGIQITEQGSGYAVEKPIYVQVEPPPATARVNMNDPMMARIVASDQPLPATTIPTKAMLKIMPDKSDPSSVASIAQKEALNEGKGGGGNCIGRACYDRPVVAVAYPRAEIDSYKSFRNPDDAFKVQKVEDALGRGREQDTKPISGSASGIDPRLPFWGGGQSSSQLLSLLPAGIGLQYDQQMKRYMLAVDPVVRENNPGLNQQFPSNKPLDPEFGPRGRSPIETDLKLGVEAYVRFAASGAVCCSVAHLLLTPIDVVKTKVQTNPVKYTTVISSFKTILEEEGPGSFLNGWAPTFAGYFVWGGVAYTLTEFFRRLLQDAAGANASNFEVYIILLASACAALVGSATIAPFEAVRIRSVAQPDFADNILGVLDRMVKEEGIPSLFSAVPVFLFKEIPFAMAKFTVFDLSTQWMYSAFPAAREDLQLSLLVSLLGGTLGGICAAIVSNPADATISEMKKSSAGLGPVEAAKLILDRAGPAGLFKGLSLRFFFYSILVSLQFLLYDAVRISLGVGSDDLKLYLDVLGGALRESGGPV